MCGIVGVYNFSSQNKLTEQALKKMAGVLKHRGPDDEGFLNLDEVSFCFRRLSIVDVEGGHQPMTNEDCSLSLVLNGEIYNHQEIKKELISKGHRFKTRCDAEVILHLYEEKKEKFLERLNGMFAFALYDKKERKLILARDRIGIKPLYYIQLADKLLFASEIKAILESKEVKRTPNLKAIDNFLSFRYIPGPESIFNDIYKLPPGHILICKNGKINITSYWQPELYSGEYKTDKYYIDKFGELLEDSVSLRLMSDVPLGAYLSGGLDSSTVVAIMSKLTKLPVKTFSFGFGNFKGDELSQAKERAKLFGCQHQEVYFQPKDFELLPKLVWFLDEPQGDAIALPIYLLSQKASREIKVALTGEGADEVLAGYLFHKTINLAQLYKKIIPKPFRRGVFGPLAKIIPVSLLNYIFDYPGSLGQKGKEKILNYLKVLEDKSPQKNYHFLISLFDKTDKNSLYTESFKKEIVAFSNQEDEELNNKHSYLDKLLLLQYRDWLPDNILLRQDKMSMANSLEVRVPFLDHRLVEFLLKVPPHLKVHFLTEKYLLRKYAKKILPEKVSKIKKQAFYIPVENYFKSPTFQKLIAQTLSESQVKKRGYFNYSQIKEIKDRLNKNEFIYTKQIVALVMLELWHQIFIDKENIL